MNLVYFEDIHLANPNYLLVVGDPGSTWGFYGGNNEKNDYFNILRSLGSNSAVRVGLRLGIDSHTEIDDDKESSPTTSDENITKTDVMLDFEFGTDMGDTEFSTYFTFGMTPATINFMGYDGKFTGTYDDPINGNTTADGKASMLSFALQTKARTNKGLFFFDNSYAVFSLSYQGQSSELTDPTNVKVEDESSGGFSIYSTYRLFNNQNLADDKIFLVYGLGGSMNFYTAKDENLLSGSKTEDSDLGIGIVSPIFNLGLEAKLKYTTLRFGMERMISTLAYSSSTSIYDDGVGTTDNEDKLSDFILGGNGVYNYNAGMGFNYGNLQLDILVNNNFWIMGPQMIFDANFGTLGVCADLVYTF